MAAARALPGSITCRKAPSISQESAVCVVNYKDNRRRKPSGGCFILGRLMLYNALGMHFVGRGQTAPSTLLFSTCNGESRSADIKITANIKIPGNRREQAPALQITSNVFRRGGSCLPFCHPERRRSRSRRIRNPQKENTDSSLRSE